MAFRYLIDGEVYQDDFHFCYIYGFNPPKEFIEEIDEPKVEGSMGLGEGTRMTHPSREASGRRRIRGTGGRGPEWC